MQIRSFSSSASLLFGLNSSVAILQSYNVIPDWQYYPTVHIVAVLVVA